MATGDVTRFNRAALFFLNGIFDTSGASNYKFGIINGTSQTPTAGDVSPEWPTYSGNQITTGTSYTGPVDVDFQVAYASGEAWVQFKSFTIAQDGAGQESVTAWGIIYDDNSATDKAVAFMELGTIDLTADSVTIKFNGADSGNFGNVFAISAVA